MTMDASTPNRDSGSAADVASEVETGLLLRVLETAARALSVGTWPAAHPPVAGADAPEVEAVVDVDPDNAGDDDGLQVAVFRFMTIVDDDQDPRPAFEMRLADARALARGDDADGDGDGNGDGDGDDARVGDEVGVELSLPLVAAAAGLLVDRLLAHDDRLQPLPPDLVANLRTSQRLDGIRARLASLAHLEYGGHGDLDDDGGMAVFQARSQALRQLDTNKCIAESAFVLVDGVPTQLLLIVRGDRVTLLHRSNDDTVSLHALRTALRPAPGPNTIASAVVAALTSTPLVRALGGRSEQLSDLRLDLASDNGVGAADLLTLEGTLHLRDDDGRSLDARRVEIPLRGDVVALCAPVAGNARDELDRRLEAAAGVFAHRLAQPLPQPLAQPQSEPNDDARPSGDQAIDVRLAHSALLRVLVRAARASSLEAHEDLLLSLDAVDAGTDDRLAVDFARAGGNDDAVLGRCILDPARGGIVMMVASDTIDATPREVCVARGGRTIDGDDEAARAFCLMLADAIAGTDADSTLLFGDDDDDDDDGLGNDDGTGGETQLSVWLQSLAALPPAGLLPPDVDAARSWQHLLDVVFGATG